VGNGLTNIQEKNNGQNADNIRYFYKKINIDLLPTYNGSSIPNEDKIDEYFNGWNALKYYYSDGRYYIRCKKDEKIINDRTYIYFGEANKTPFYIKGSNDSFTHAETYSLPINGATYYWSYDSNILEDLAEIKTNDYFNNDLYF